MYNERVVGENPFFQQGCPMAESDPRSASTKARYSYLENVGCVLFFLVGGICYASMSIMQHAFQANSGTAGACAVAALATMGVGVSYFLVRPRER